MKKCLERKSSLVHSANDQINIAGLVSHKQQDDITFHYCMPAHISHERYEKGDCDNKLIHGLNPQKTLKTVKYLTHTSVKQFH